MRKFESDTFCDRATSLFGDMGQVELSQKIGIAQGVISAIKNKKVKAPGADTVCALARYFNVSADWLLGLSEKSVEPLLGDTKAKYVSTDCPMHLSAKKTTNKIIIQIALDEYRDLAKKAALIAAATRYISKTEYVSAADLKLILDIRDPATEGEGKR